MGEAHLNADWRTLENVCSKFICISGMLFSVETMILHKAFVYRIYPTRAQTTALGRTLDICRDIYNSMLRMRKHDYEIFGKSPSCHDQIKMLPVWKATHAELCGVHSQVLQNVVKRVDLAFDAFFRRVKAGETPGYPRFKEFGQYDSFTYAQSGFSVQDNLLILSKIGPVKIAFHRPVSGKIKTLTIRRRGEKWYVCFSSEVEEEPLPSTGKEVGIDVGITHFATLSDGSKIDNPRFFRNEQKVLAKAQRKSDALRKTRSSQSARNRARKVVTRVHERIRFKRHNFIHQITRSLVNEYDLIAVEELQIENIVRRPKPKLDGETRTFLPNGASRKAGLNKSVLDAAWGMFLFSLASKAESADRKFRKCEPAYTSQDCSNCGERVSKGLDIRVHSCPNCGIVLCRDHNAAINILARGLSCIGRQSVEAARFIGAE